MLRPGRAHPGVVSFAFVGGVGGCGLEVLRRRGSGDGRADGACPGEWMNISELLLVERDV